MTFSLSSTSSLLKLAIKFDIPRHLYEVICIHELTHRVLQLATVQHRIRLKLLCSVSIMKFSSFQECPPPLEPKCVVHVTALELPTGEDLTWYTRHLCILPYRCFLALQKVLPRIDNSTFFSSLLKCCHRGFRRKSTRGEEGGW